MEAIENLGNKLKKMDQGNKDKVIPHCPVTDIITLISKKWAFLILRILSTNDHIRFNEIITLLDNKISPRTLSTRLKELEKNNLITRSQFSNEIPPRVEYSITKMGMDLGKTIQTLNDWAYKWDFRLNL